MLNDAFDAFGMWFAVYVLGSAALLGGLYAVYTTTNIPLWADPWVEFFAFFHPLIYCVTAGLVFFVRSVWDVLKALRRAVRCSGPAEKALVLLQGSRRMVFFLGVVVVVASVLWALGSYLFLAGIFLLFFPNGAYYLAERRLLKKVSPQRERRQSFGDIAKLFLFYSFGLFGVFMVSQSEELSTWVWVMVGLMAVLILFTVFTRVLAFDPAENTSPELKKGNSPGTL